MKNDVYTTYGVKPVINASGKMTILGGSRVQDEVCDASRLGASNFFEVKDLLDKTGHYIANLLGVEDTYIVSSASSGIAQSIAACIAKEDMGKILHLYDDQHKKRQIVMPKGHNVDYGTPIEVAINLGGGKLVEAGYANACTKEHVESCINEFTVALLYVKSHHCVQKGMISIEDMADLAKKYNLKFLIDAAAEEDLTRYYYLGADAVMYSGTKALEGPTSGLIVGRKAFLNDVKLQSKGIGRVLKVGKENILALTTAIEAYTKRIPLTLEEQVQRLEEFHHLMNQLPGVHCSPIQDGAGRAIMRSEVRFDETCKHSASVVTQRLKQGELRIYTRDYRANIGVIEIDIRDVQDEELLQIYNKIKDILEGE